MASVNKANDRALADQIDRVEDKLDQLSDCLKRLKDIAGGTRIYWEGSAGREHQALLRDISSDAEAEISRLRGVTQRLREERGLAAGNGRTAASATAHTLPDDLL